MQETILKNGRQYRSHPVHLSGVFQQQAISKFSKRSAKIQK
jgi:hypothetical protein